MPSSYHSETAKSSHSSAVWPVPPPIAGQRCTHIVHTRMRTCVHTLTSPVAGPGSHTHRCLGPVYSPGCYKAEIIPSGHFFPGLKEVYECPTENKPGFQKVPVISAKGQNSCASSSSPSVEV